MADARTGWTARVERGSLSQSTAVNTISRKAAPALVQEHEGPPDRRVQILSGTPGSNARKMFEHAQREVRRMNAGGGDDSFGVDLSGDSFGVDLESDRDGF